MPVRQASGVWNSRPSGRPTSTGCIRRPRKSRRWRWSCRAAGRSPPARSNNARPGGSADKARAPPTPSRRRSCQTSRLRVPTTPRSRAGLAGRHLAGGAHLSGLLPPHPGRRDTGHPRDQGRGRSTSFTYPQYGGGAVLDGGVLSLSKIGRLPLRLHRRLQGTPKTVTSAGKRTVGTPASPVRRY